LAEEELPGVRPTRERATSLRFVDELEKKEKGEKGRERSRSAQRGGSRPSAMKGTVTLKSRSPSRARDPSPGLPPIPKYKFFKELRDKLKKKKQEVKKEKAKEAGPVTSGTSTPRVSSKASSSNVQLKSRERLGLPPRNPPPPGTGPWRKREKGKGKGRGKKGQGA